MNKLLVMLIIVCVSCVGRVRLQTNPSKIVKRPITDLVIKKDTVDMDDTYYKPKRGRK